MDEVKKEKKSRWSTKRFSIFLERFKTESEEVI